MTPEGWTTKWICVSHHQKKFHKDTSRIKNQTGTNPSPPLVLSGHAPSLCPLTYTTSTECVFPFLLSPFSRATPPVQLLPTLRSLFWSSTLMVFGEPCTSSVTRTQKVFYDGTQTLWHAAGEPLSAPCQLRFIRVTSTGDNVLYRLSAVTLAYHFIPFFTSCAQGHWTLPGNASLHTISWTILNSVGVILVFVFQMAQLLAEGTGVRTFITNFSSLDHSVPLFARNKGKFLSAPFTAGISHGFLFVLHKSNNKQGHLKFGPHTILCRWHFGAEINSSAFQFCCSDLGRWVRSPSPTAVGSVHTICQFQLVNESPFILCNSFVHLS